MITHNKKGKDITYVTNVRMPTTKAHGTQMIKMCEAFASVGATVVFYVPWRHNPITEDAFSYYDVARTFDIKKLPSIDFILLIKLLRPKPLLFFISVLKSNPFPSSL